MPHLRGEWGRRTLPALSLSLSLSPKASTGKKLHRQPRLCGESRETSCFACRVRLSLTQIVEPRLREAVDVQHPPSAAKPSPPRLPCGLQDTRRGGEGNSSRAETNAFATRIPIKGKGRGSRTHPEIVESNAHGFKDIFSFQERAFILEHPSSA